MKKKKKRSDGGEGSMTCLYTLSLIDQKDKEGMSGAEDVKSL